MPDVKRSRRFPVNWPMLIKGFSESGTDIVELTALENLSSKGALFYSETALELNTSLDILIRLPMQSAVYMKYAAKVIRVEARSEKFGIAVQFQNPRPQFVRNPASMVL